MQVLDLNAANGNQVQPENSIVLNPGPSHSDIDELAERSKGGCSASFEALVRQFEARIFQYILQITGNQHDAEDLTQVTFLKAFRNIHRYQCRHAFTAWIFTIAKRTALNHLRDRKPAEELGPDLAADTDDPSARVARTDDTQDLWALARSLSSDQHEALWLRYGEGMSISQVAGVMRTTALRVRVLLHRGRNNLAKKVAQQRTGSAM